MYNHYVLFLIIVLKVRDHELIIFIRNKINKFTFAFSFSDFLSDLDENFSCFSFSFFFYFLALFENDEKNLFKNEKNLKKKFSKLLFCIKQHIA